MSTPDVAEFHRAGRRATFSAIVAKKLADSGADA
jgi:hypothetical protein